MKYLAAPILALALLAGCSTTPPDLKADLEVCALALFATGSTDYKVLFAAATATPACLRLPEEMLSGLVAKAKRKV